MRQTSKTPSAQTKKRIQELLRQIGLARQEGICFFSGKEIGGKTHLECTSKQTKDGHIIMQYDHLNPREHNVSFADARLGIVICQGLHGWKSFNDGNKRLYDAAAKHYLPPDIVKLWELVEADRKSHPMGAWEWQKIELALTQDLAQGNY